MSVVRQDLRTEQRFEIANGVLELFGTGNGGSSGESGGGERSGVEIGGEEDGEDWIGSVGGQRGRWGGDCGGGLAVFEGGETLEWWVLPRRRH